MAQDEFENVNLTINAKNSITLGSNIVAGSFGEGVVDGNTTVTFKGDGDKLDFEGDK